MKRLKQLIAGMALVLGVGFVLAPVGVSAVTVDPFADACTTNPNSEVCKAQDDSISNVIITVVNVLLFIIGIISVIMIIVGGILYAVSGGDSGGVTKAKNTILYAIVGLAVAFFAYAIVNWVIDRFV
jgi:hypothetical protein